MQGKVSRSKHLDAFHAILRHGYGGDGTQPAKYSLDVQGIQRIVFDQKEMNAVSLFFYLYPHELHPDLSNDYTQEIYVIQLLTAQVSCGYDTLCS